MENKLEFEKVFRVFEKNYKDVPLEIYGSNAYKSLVATLLSARTRDDMTLKVCETKLFPKAYDVHSLDRLSEEEIAGLIFPVGFYKTKAKHLKKLARELIVKFDGKVPRTRKELMSLPGVGRKTANLVMNRAFGVPAIAVDTHVHRISNMLGWVETVTPEKTELELMRAVPKKYWTKMNRLFVSIGQQYRSANLVKRFLQENKLIK